MRRLRIAWLGHQSASLGGGMATYSQEIVAGLRRRGHQVTFFHHGDRTGEGPEESFESVPLASVNVPLVKPLVLSPGRAKKKLIDRLRQREFDLVHASFWFSSMDFDLPKLTRELRIPLVATFHVAFDNRPSLWGGITSGTYRLYAPTLAKCDRVIVFGPGQRDILVNLGVPEAILRILPNGVDVDKHSPGPSDRRERFGARRLFTYMGRVDSEKNVDILLEAFLDVAPPNDHKLLIMGTGTEKRRLERFYKDRRVVFTGHIAESEERIAILRASDGFFLPSTVEGLSLSMLEAMACGVATVATDVGTDGEALRGAGIVIDPRNLALELGMALRELIELPFMSIELGRLPGAKPRLALRALRGTGRGGRCKTFYSRQTRLWLKA
ncbi:MAG: glycosyltransferase family 4 protein [Chloroflexi bacterium]|nr:MAG: glycosyltransferase family 4 protein [Chloroflexota bacterium]